MHLDQFAAAPDCWAELSKTNLGCSFANQPLFLAPNPLTIKGPYLHLNLKVEFPGS
jgi:hypothetical protein